MNFLELFKCHPEYPKKIENIIDLIIVRNKLNYNYLELNIKRINGDIEDISYIACCRNQRDKQQYLKQAMRFAISEQIQKYRDNNELICEICKSSDKIEIDHFNIKFRDLFSNFIQDRKDIPTTFDDNFYNAPMFQEKDISFKQEWHDYHLKNALLRCLCKKCNLLNK